MKTINSLRKHVRVGGTPEASRPGAYVLYWMQINRRLHYNYALDYAASWALKLRIPLVILEGLACDYPWASARTSAFLLEGMAEHASQLKDHPSITYIPFPEREAGQYAALVNTLTRHAAIVVSDEYPVFIMRERNDEWEKRLSVPFHTVDSNGILPMALSERAPYSAFVFRRLMQKYFLECWDQPPDYDPLRNMKNFGTPGLDDRVLEKQSEGYRYLSSDDQIADFVDGLDTLRQSIRPVSLRGTREAALSRLDAFLEEDLSGYDEERNNANADCTSRLSPWLHTGKISTFEIVSGVFSRQPEGWDMRSLRPAGGKRSGFFGGHPAVESFLDEVITWRETGFHHAWHTPMYADYESLPEWARKTLEDHSGDPREYVYSYMEFEEARTHDPLWNAAQIQLRTEGRIHNYLRMLWGKKVLEWTPDPRTALRYLVDLNNYYALDGRDPNSYSGIFWIFGRFDRAWGPERPVFGKIRYMSSESAMRKLKPDAYLNRYLKKGEMRDPSAKVR